MTRDEILAMKAGFDLDCLVADTLGLGFLYYSTGISAAWQVVETLQKKQTVHILLCTLSNTCIIDLGFEVGKVAIESETILEAFCEAICKAALLARLDKEWQ